MNPPHQLMQKPCLDAVVELVPVSSVEVAAACKILENIYGVVNITFVNELKALSFRMGFEDYQHIVNHSLMVLDTCKATGGVKLGREKIRRA